MNVTNEGLRTSPRARSTTALTSLSADEIVAGLSDEQKTNVAAALAPKADDAEKPKQSGEEPKAATDDKANDKPSEPEKQKEEEKPEAEAADPNHAQYRHGFQAAVDRNAAVFASEHYQGREKAAAKLLSNPKLSAEEITSTLADLPKNSAANPMLANLRETENPTLGAGSEAKGSSKAEANAVWDRTEERLGWTK